jgi:hypothetical protein
MSYAEDYIKCKEHLRDMGDALLHNRLEDVPTLVMAMRMRLVRLEQYVTAKTPALDTQEGN